MLEIKLKFIGRKVVQRKKIKKDSLSGAEDENEDDIAADKDPVDDFKTELQQAIANMSPTKFEQFARALLTKMGG